MNQRFLYIISLLGCFIFIIFVLLSKTDRSLPTGVTISKPELYYPGYTLITRLDIDKAMLLDMKGKIVHSWTLDYGHGFQYATLNQSGELELVRTHKNHKGYGEYIILDWDSNIKRRVRLNTHHDFQHIGNGNILFLTRRLIDDKSISPFTFISDFIEELTPQNQIVWRWNLLDHLKAIEEQTAPHKLPNFEKDWAHMNAIDIIPKNRSGELDQRFKIDNILFSIQRFDTIGVIDRQTSQVVWAWGPGVIEGQHDPQLLENGNILLFDNGNKRKYSRVIEVNPIQRKIVWQYPRTASSEFFSIDRGGVQRLPNGNTLIAMANRGQLLEVTKDGQIAWEFYHPNLKGMKRYPKDKKDFRSFSLYRAQRYPASDIDLFLKGKQVAGVYKDE